MPRKTGRIEYKKASHLFFIKNNQTAHIYLETYLYYIAKNRRRLQTGVGYLKKLYTFLHFLLVEENNYGLNI